MPGNRCLRGGRRPSPRSRWTAPSGATRSRRELVEDLRPASRRAQDDADVRVVRLRGAGRGVLRGLRHRLGRGGDAQAEADAAVGPDGRLRDSCAASSTPTWRCGARPSRSSPRSTATASAGGTDFALCSDLIVCSEDCRIGYPPARVWGSPTTAMWTYRLGLERSKRLLLTGDALDGRRAVEWGLASEAVPEAELDAAALALCERMARLPANQLQMMKLLVNTAIEQLGLRTTQLVGTLLDGAARHTPEGVAFSRAAAEDVRGAVADRDAPFGDYGQGPRDGLMRAVRPPAAALGGVVLAGGDGRRLGGDKAVVALDGRPLLEFPLRRPAALRRDVAVVAKRGTSCRPRVRGADLARARRAAAPARGRRPRAALRARAAGARRRRRPAAARRGAAASPWRGARRSRAAVVARAGGRLQPLLARYEPRRAGGARGRSTRPPARPTSSLALDPLVLDVEDEEQLLNVNRPEDLLRASALVRGAPGMTRPVRPGAAPP